MPCHPCAGRGPVVKPMACRLHTSTRVWTMDSCLRRNDRRRPLRLVTPAKAGVQLQGQKSVMPASMGCPVQDLSDRIVDPLLKWTHFLPVDSRRNLRDCHAPHALLTPLSHGSLRRSPSCLPQVVREKREESIVIDIAWPDSVGRSGRAWNCSARPSTKPRQHNHAHQYPDSRLDARARSGRSPSVFGSQARHLRFEVCPGIGCRLR